jgi:hypothetical protein
MESNSRRPLAVGLTVLGAVARLLPHAPNFTPVGSMSLFGGARLRSWQAYLLPLVLMVVTDPLVGGYSAATPFVYASFLISVWLGGRYLRSSENAVRIGAVCAVSSLQFFLITNFGTWLGTALYPHTASGLAACYVAAIPFYGRTLAGDLLYTAALFGLHAWLSRALARSERVALQTA